VGLPTQPVKNKREESDDKICEGWIHE